MQEPAAVVQEATVTTVPGATVWRAIANGDERLRWWTGLDLDPRPGGRLVERWTDDGGGEQITRGEVVAVEDGHFLRWQWADEGWEAPTEVELRVHSVPEGTRVVVRESGWERLPDGNTLADEHRAGWEHARGSLAPPPRPAANRFRAVRHSAASVTAVRGMSLTHHRPLPKAFRVGAT